MQSAIVGGVAFMGNVLGSATSGIEGWIPLLVQSGAIGLLAFVIWHVFAKFIPALQQSHKETHENMGRILDEQRKEFLTTLRDHRQETSAALKDLASALREMRK